MQPINFYSRNYLLPLLSAFLLILSFPRINLGFLAWFSLLPLFFYCQRKGTSWKQCFLGGALLGFPLFLYLHAYMSLSVNFFLPPIYGYLLIIIAAVYSCLFTALFAAGFFFLLRGGKVYALSLGAPSLWVLLEKLRSAGLLGTRGGSSVTARLIMVLSYKTFPFMVIGAWLSSWSFFRLSSFWPGKKRAEN